MPQTVTINGHGRPRPMAQGLDAR